MTAAVTVEMVQAFADAWNRHDVEALMTFMDDDCVFETSAGPDACGTRYAGRDAVRRGFAEVFATFPDAHWGARAMRCSAIALAHVAGDPRALPALESLLDDPDPEFRFAVAEAIDALRATRH